MDGNKERHSHRMEAGGQKQLDHFFNENWNRVISMINQWREV